MFIPFPVVALPQVKLTGLVGLDNPFGVTMLHILFGLSFNVLLYTAFLRSSPTSWRRAPGWTAPPPGRPSGS